jgi:hypothetical protein
MAYTHRAGFGVAGSGLIAVFCFVLAARSHNKGDILTLILSGTISASGVVARYRPRMYWFALQRNTWIDGWLPIWIAMSVACFMGVFEALGLEAYSLSSFLPTAVLIYTLWPLWVDVTISARNGALSARALLLLCAVVSFYGAGFLQIMAGWKQLFFTLGAIAILFLVVSLLRALKPWMSKTLAALAACIFRTDGELYLTAALVSLAATMFMLMAKVDFIAEQFSMVTYYGILHGISLKFLERVKLKFQR